MLTSAPTAVVAAPAQVDSENEPSELSHLTVVVTEDDSDPDDVVSTFTITWNDAEDCSASYNAYLDDVVGEPIHLGSAASEGEQIAGSLTNVSAETFGFNAKLHCGTIGSGRLVDRLWIPEYNRSFGTLPISRAYLPKPGTYSTEPGLIALTVSSGTLTPAFHNHTLNYTVPDVPNADGRFTLTTTAKADYYNVAFLPGSYYTFFSVCSHGGQQTSLSYGDDAGNRIYPLTDADANTPGFQMDLDEGENVFYIRVWPNCETGQLYKLTVTRAANAPANTPATGAPTIGGTARVGQTLTADTTGIADSDGLENATFAYQWLADDTDIADATDSTYTLVAAAEGKTIKVRVSFTDDADNDETLTSAATGEVEALPNRPATGAPTISGTAQVGEALTADTSGIADDDGLNNVSYSYQWIRNDGSSDTDITDATGSTYTLVDADEGKTIKVEVSFTDDAGNGESLTSEATAEVAARPNTPATGTPTISGTAKVGETLTADTSGIADADGLTNVSYSYQWIPNDGSFDTDNQDAPGSTYTLADSDEGKTIKVEVSFTDDAGNGESLTSAATATVASSNPTAGICDRTEQVQDAILGMLNGVVDDCADVTDSHLAGITIGLRISNGPYDRQALSLQSGDFAGLVNIEQLAIYNHTMDALPEDVFDGLGSLESLDLSDNEIAALPEGVFDGLGSLESLDLSGNEIAALPEGVFDGLGSLEWLDLSDNEIAALSEDVFDGLGSLESLDLSDNEIAALPEDVFDGLGSLESLDLGVNQIGTLPEDVFDGLGSLKYLELSGNRINALLEDVFDGLGNLKYLRLSFNQLSALPDYVFDDLGNLVHLNVQENQLSALPEDVFNGLGSLERLDLSYNEIAALPDYVFDGLGNLKLLRLDSNDLASPPEDVFDGLDSLTRLILSHNRIHTLSEDVFEGLGNLTYLSLDGNPGTPFTLTAYLERQGDNAVLVKVAEGVPFDMAVTLSATGGTLSAASVTIKGGTADSEAVTVTLSGDGPVTVSVTSAVFQAVNYFGIQTGLGEPLILGGYAVGGNHPATGAPAISSTAQVGETLTADTSGIADADGLTTVSYGYQWVANDGTTDTDIPDATDAAYTLVADDEGQTVKVRVSFTDDAGNEETLTSAATAAVAAPEPPAMPTGLSPSVSHDTVTLTWDDPQDDSITGYVILRRDREIHLVGTFVTITGDTGSADTTYTDATVEPDKQYVYRIKAINEHGEVSEESDWVRANTPAVPVPDKPTGLSAVVISHDTVTLAWDNPQDDSITGYVILRRDREIHLVGTFVTITGDTGSAQTTYTDETVEPDKEYVYRIKAINEHGEVSERSDWVRGFTPAAPPTDSPATGEPTITGTAQVGEMLTVDTSRIADDDGLVNATYTYQWVANDGTTDTNISGATDNTYTLVDDDEGMTIKVRVTIIDDAENETTLTSAATEAVGFAVQQQGASNTPATGQPTISGTAQVGEMLTADTTGIADEDGLNNAVFGYQWLSDDAEIGGATGSTYTPVADDEGKTITVQVSFTDDGGNDETLTSTATDVVAEAARPNSPATGAPAITGTAQVGETLTADTTGIADEDGLEDVAFSYQWLSDDAEIGGATGSTYTPVADDEGKTITVQVSFTDDLGNATTLTSAATEAVAAAPQPDSPATGEPTITGTAQVGQTLSVDTSGIADDDGLDSAVFAYQWLSDDAEIGGATGLTYTLVDDDEGRTIKVRVTVTDDLGNETTLTSAATEAVAAAPPTDSPTTGEPTITGTAQVGQTLTVDTSGITDADGLDSAVFAYQWLSDDAEIGGATGLTYTLVDDDEGRTIKVRVTVTDDLGNETTLTSAATEAVAAAPQPDSPATGEPTITGTAQVGQTLSVDTSGIADADGLEDVAFSYLWLSDDAGIGGATGSTYTLVDDDEGRTIKVRVTVTDDLGNETTLTSAATEAVEAKRNTAATGRPTISGTVRVGETLTADTTGIADADGLTNVSYRYQWVVTDGGAYIDISGEKGATYTLVSADRGLRILVRVSFTDDAGKRERLTSAATDVVAAAA